MMLTAEMWTQIADLIPAPKRAPNGGGRPAYPRRQVLEGILWVLASGARWKDLPSTYPGYKTCHRLFQEWQQQGVFEEIFHTLSSKNKRTSCESGFIDGTFVPAKKGDHSLAGVTKEKAAQSWPSAMALVCLLDLAFMEQMNTRHNV